MKKRKILSIILMSIIVIAGMSSVVLYKLGDRIFDEIIDTQITEIEKTMEETEDKAAQAAQPAQPAVVQGEQQIPVQAPVVRQPENKPTAPPQEQQITKDKLVDIKDSVTPTDKMTAAKLVLSKLSQADIKEITNLTAGGITPEEKEQMIAIVYSRFTQEEIEDIKAMYTKYMK